MHVNLFWVSRKNKKTLNFSIHKVKKLLHQIIQNTEEEAASCIYLIGSFSSCYEICISWTLWKEILAKNNRLLLIFNQC